MLATTKPLFGKLPQELYREIYDYDDTYRNVFNTHAFLDELLFNSYKTHYNYLYRFIDKVVQPENRMNNVVTDYIIRLKPHPENSNITCFILESTNTTQNSNSILNWSGYISTPEYDEVFMVYHDDMNYRIDLKVSDSYILYYQKSISYQHIDIYDYEYNY